MRLARAILLAKALRVVSAGLQEEATCVDFTVDSCSIDAGDLVQELPGVPVELCQAACDQFKNCVLFRYSRADQTCQLLSRDFRQNCKVVGGARNSDLDACLNSDLNGCNAFIEESCDFIGDDLAFSPPDGEISNPYECEEICQTFELLGCKYWLYDVAKLSCRLLGSGDRTCDFISGPQAPTLGECISSSTPGPTTLPPTTAPPTASPTSQPPPSCNATQNFTYDDTFTLYHDPTGNMTVNWTKAPDGSVWRNDNGEASVAFLQVTEADIRFTGSFQTSDNDDDWLGVVVGLADESHFYLIFGSGVGDENHMDPWRILLVNSTTGSSDNLLLNAILSGSSVPGQTEVLHTWPGKHWQSGLTYGWEVTYRPGQSIAVSFVEEGVALLDGSVELDNTTTFPGADKIGIFSFSQVALFSSMSYECV